MPTNQDKQDEYNDDIFQFAGNTLFSGTSIILFFVLLMTVAILFASLGDTVGDSISSQSTDEEKTSNLFVILIVGVVAIIALMGGIRYFFGTSVYASISNFFGPDPEIDVVIDHKSISGPVEDAPPMPPSDGYEYPDPPVVEPIQKQVFNIPGNYYGYESAKNLCAAYDSRLATYDEIESSYEDGGEWCNYGWSDGQMALFPTQGSTYDQLQKIDGHENDCGRPGINGGYMKNPHVKYGVNCYGVKPQIDDDEKFLMENASRFPKTKKDKAREEDVERMKKNIGNVLVSPFNHDQWSRY